MDENARTLAVMLDALAQVGAPHAVFGGLLAQYYGTRRATGDVDLLVPRHALEPLEPALRHRGYEVRRYPYLLRMFSPGRPEPVGDFVMVESNAVVESAFAARTPGEILGLPVSVVPRGVFVALKFEAAVRSRRLSKDRVTDVHDIRGVLARGFGPQDEQLATQLAAKMFAGAVPDLASFLDDLRSERWPRVVVRAEMRNALLRRQGLAALRGRGLFRRT
jgi:hypothetical protein